MGGEGEMKPVASDGCCPVWPVIAKTFSWFRYTDWPELSCMPHIQGMRINHCPSCGREVRGIVMHTASVSEEPL